MRPGPVFILTFRDGLYRCPSSDLKGRYGLGGLPQRCQTPARSSAACDIFTSAEYTQPVPSVWSRYTPSPVFPSPRGVPRQDGGDGGVSGEHRQCHAIWPRWSDLIFSIGNKGANKQLSGPGQKFGLSRNMVHSQKGLLFKRNVPKHNSGIME